MWSIRLCSISRSRLVSAIPTKSNRYGSFVDCWARSESTGGRVAAKLVTAFPTRSCSLVSICRARTFLDQPCPAASRRTVIAGQRRPASPAARSGSTKAVVQAILAQPPGLARPPRTPACISSSAASNPSRPGNAPANPPRAGRSPSCRSPPAPADPGCPARSPSK